MTAGDIILAILWIFNSIMYARLGHFLYIRWRYGSLLNYRVERFDRAFARFK